MTYHHSRWLFALTALAASLAGSRVVTAIPLIINEYNAVAPDNYLGGDTWSAADGTDSFLANYPGLDGTGRVQGNLGNWIELVVTEDHVDLRGWKVVWEEDFFEGNVAIGSRGGEIILSPTASLLSDLRRGTILTISEQDSIKVDLALVGDYKNRTQGLLPEEVDVTINLATDTSYNPQLGDWWIHLSTKNEADKTDPLVTTVVNNPPEYTGDAPKPGDFAVTHDNWSAIIFNAANQQVTAELGEGIGTSGIGGVNSREVVKLEENPTANPNYLSYKDGDSSSFGQPNVWSSGARTQDFTALRSGLSFTLAGDYNSDGVVDAGDYTVWRNSVGTTDLSANGDDTGASQGVIDGADYLVWKNNYGASGGALSLNQTAVPEPAFAGALMLALLGVWNYRARSRGRLTTLAHHRN